MQHLIYSIALSLVLLYGSEGRSVGESVREVWRPAVGTKDEWMRCHGHSCLDWARTKEKLARLKMMVTPNDSVAKSPVENKTQELYGDSLDGCIWLTEEQIDEMIDRYSTPQVRDGVYYESIEESEENLELESSESHEEDDNGEGKTKTTHSRQKRKLIPNAFSVWDLPIVWKFDGDHTPEEMATIRGAFQHWMDNTCVTFREIGTTEEYDGNHILVTRASTGCYSYVGRIYTKPQQLNLQSACVRVFGTIAHEIGHSLGLWHEQQRADRDDHITVQWENLGYYTGQFVKQNTIAHGVPYDVGSVMHYAQYDGSSNGKVTMQTKDPLLQSSMGQRTGISFADAKIINRAYCQGVCSSTLDQACEHGGYQDPLNCHQCRCPDGFSGTYCQQVAPSKSACGGEIHVRFGAPPSVILSPGYNSPGYYANRDECNWRIVAPAGENIRLQFVEKFGVYCHYSQQCYHWVEVKHSTQQLNQGTQGSRFCCYRTPTETLVSEGNEMVVTLRANWTTSFPGARKGFKAVVAAVPSQVATTTRPTPTTTTRSTTTTTSKITTTPPPTTRMPTTVPTTRRTTRRTTHPATTTRDPTTIRTTVKITTTGPATGCEKLDVAFVLDSSGSVTISNWLVLLNLAKKLTSRLTIGQDSDRLGIVSFGNEGSANIRLTDFNDADSLTEAISEVPYKDEWTNTSGGIWVARTELFDSSPRPEAHKAMVIITDGPSNRDAKRTIPEADAARQAGIDLYVMAIGRGVALTEVNAIAKDERHVLMISAYDNLNTNSALDNLLHLICPGSSTGSGDTLWSCSFEESSVPLCGMTQSTSDEFDWTRQSGATPSGMTGPSSASHGTHYVYIEASSPRKNGDRARLIFPDLALDGTYCVQFAYHMYGHHIDRLSLVKNTGGDSVIMWKMTGPVGDKWGHAETQIKMSPGDELLFEGERGMEFSGDIAIDDLSIHENGC